MNDAMFPEEYMSPTTTAYYLHTWREIESWLNKTVTASGRPRPFKKVTFMFTEEQLIMARARGAKTNGNPVGKTNQPGGSSGNNVRWANVVLDNNDSAFLAESAASFSELAAMACEYVTNGYNLTIKPMDGGDSVMACLIGKSSDDPNVTVGVSGFASNVRDALLVLCYKFEDKLGGQLPLPDGATGNNRPRFR